MMTSPKRRECCDWRPGATGSGSARGLVCSDRTGTGDRKRQADNAHDETTWECTSAHSKNPQIAPAGGRREGQTQGVDDADEGGHALNYDAR